MAFGVKASEEPAKDRANNSGDSWIKWFAEGDTTLHVLQELTEWYVYWEHFSQTMSRGYPCTRDRKTCPGCTSKNDKEAKASKRYLVNAMKDNYIDLYKIPASIYDDFVRFADKDGGSVLKRDFTVVRYKKSDGTTKYSVDREDRNEIPESLYIGKLHDFEEALLSAYNQVWGPQDEQPERPDVDLKSKTEEIIASRGIKKSEVTSYVLNDDPPFDPAEADQVLSEDELRQMTPGQILRLFQVSGLEAPLEGTWETTNELADLLIKALG